MTAYCPKSSHHHISKILQITWIFLQNPHKLWGSLNSILLKEELEWIQYTIKYKNRENYTILADFTEL